MTVQTFPSNSGQYPIQPKERVQLILRNYTKVTRVLILLNHIALSHVTILLKRNDLSDFPK